LARTLSGHPEIRMAYPARPEPKYFLKNELGKDATEHYRDTFFKGAHISQSQYLGEKSTSYIESGLAARNIKSLLPGVKLIFLFREPIERALSNITFSRSHGFETDSTENAITRELDNPEKILSAEKAGISVSPHSYLARGCYAQFLSNYLDIFDPSDIHIDLMENVIGSENGLRAIEGFLDIAKSVYPDSRNAKVNAGDRNDEEPLSNATRARLAEFFEPHNEALKKMTGLDLSPWKQNE